MLRTLDLTIRAPRVAAGLDDRSVTGVALPYREVGRTSAGAVSVAAGAIRMPADLRHVKLFSDHGRATPVGYATAADDSPDRLDMTFHVAGTPSGDTALLEAAEGVRDALSVELSDVTIRGGVIVSAALDAVALVPLPAYRSARLTLAADTPDDDDPADDDPAPAVTVTEPADPTTPDDGDADADPDPKETPDVTTHPPAPPAPASPTDFGRSRDPQALITAGVARLDAVLRGASDAAQVNAALTDIVPANDPAEGYLRHQWIDELWTPYYLEQFLSNAVSSAPLTGNKVVGWRWKTLPTVGTYAGSKAAIPSSPVLLEPASADPYRIAGGWDVDRIFTDLGQGDFAGAVLNAAAIDAARKVESAVATAILAAAFDVDITGAADVFGQIAAVVAHLVAQGAAASFVGVAPDVFASILAVKSTDAPWWLTPNNVSVAGQSGSMADVKFGVSTGLPAGGIVAGDRRAFTHYQTPNIKVQALNIPNGGIDIGLFLYAADLVNNAAGLAKATIPAVP